MQKSIVKKDGLTFTSKLALFSTNINRLSKDAILFTLLINTLKSSISKCLHDSIKLKQT